MATKRTVLLFDHFVIWTLFCVIICGAQNSGDMGGLSAALKENALPLEISTLISKLTSFQETLETDQSTTAGDLVTNFTNKSDSTTSSAETTNDKLSSTTPSFEVTNEKVASTTSSASTTQPAEETTPSTTATTTATTTASMNVGRDTENSALLTTLNGYKIATICLAVIMAIILLIILIYFSTKSKTGHGDISHPPNTPPLDMDDFPRDEEPKSVVRLSSYFPYADNTLSKSDRPGLNGNGCGSADDDYDDDDDRKVTTFLTRKKSIEDATGSQDKILHTSDL